MKKLDLETPTWHQNRHLVCIWWNYRAEKMNQMNYVRTWASFRPWFRKFEISFFKFIAIMINTFANFTASWILAPGAWSNFDQHFFSLIPTKHTTPNSSWAYKALKLFHSSVQRFFCYRRHRLWIIILTLIAWFTKPLLHFNFTIVVFSLCCSKTSRSKYQIVPLQLSAKPTMQDHFVNIELSSSPYMLWKCMRWHVDSAMAICKLILNAPSKSVSVVMNTTEGLVLPVSVAVSNVGQKTFCGNQLLPRTMKYEI